MTMTGYRHKYVLSFDISKKYYSVNTEKISEHTVSSKGGDYRQKKNERLRRCRRAYIVRYDESEKRWFRRNWQRLYYFSLYYILFCTLNASHAELSVLKMVLAIIRCSTVVCAPNLSGCILPIARMYFTLTCDVVTSSCKPTAFHPALSHNTVCSDAIKARRLSSLPAFHCAIR